MSVHYDEIKLSVSFSLSRKMVAAIRERATRLGVPMSAYVSALVHNDLVRGREAHLELLAAKGKLSPPARDSNLGAGVQVDLSGF
jgi:hypothetical protein